MMTTEGCPNESVQCSPTNRTQISVLKYTLNASLGSVQSSPTNRTQISVLEYTSNASLGIYLCLKI